MTVYETNKIAIYVYLIEALKSEHSNVKITSDVVSFNNEFNLTVNEPEDNSTNNVTIHLENTKTKCTVDKTVPWFSIKSQPLIIINEMLLDLAKKSDQLLSIIFQNVVAIGNTVFPTIDTEMSNGTHRMVVWSMGTGSTFKVIIHPTSVEMVLKSDVKEIVQTTLIPINKFTPDFFSTKTLPAVRLLMT